MTSRLPVDDAESVPPPGKRRPWIKWILYPFLLIPLVIPLLIVVSVVYSLLTTDDNYRQEMAYSGELKVVEHDFREHFHNLRNYPALSLEELKTQHVLSGFASRTLDKYRHEYEPFSPGTPDSAVVLTIHGRGAEPDRFTKRDLTADPFVLDPASPETSSPSVSPSP